METLSVKTQYLIVIGLWSLLVLVIYLIVELFKKAINKRAIRKGIVKCDNCNKLIVFDTMIRRWTHDVGEGSFYNSRLCDLFAEKESIEIPERNIHISR